MTELHHPHSHPHVYSLFSFPSGSTGNSTEGFHTELHPQAFLYLFVWDRSCYIVQVGLRCGVFLCHKASLSAAITRVHHMPSSMFMLKIHPLNIGSVLLLFWSASPSMELQSRGEKKDISQNLIGQGRKPLCIEYSLHANTLLGISSSLEAWAKWS